MLLNNEKKVAFADTFIKEFVDKGFGVLSKRETELLIFHLLSDLVELDSMSNYELALKLKITPTKVKNYRFERRLRYSQLSDEQIKIEIIKGLQKSNIKVNKASKWILLSIEESYVREAIKSKLKQLNHFIDSSFNSEIISLDLDAFIELISYYYKEVKLEELNDKELINFASELLREDPEKITMNGLMKCFVEGAVQKAGEGTFTAGLSFLTGGVSDFIGLIKGIKRFHT